MDHNKSNRFYNKLKLLIASLLALGLILPVFNAWGHASLVKSDPPRRATLSESPAKVQLWFNEEIEIAYAAVSVVDVNGNRVSRAEPEAVADDLKSLKLELPELSPGAYKVEFRVLSIDGHVVDSSYSFRIKDN